MPSLGCLRSGYAKLFGSLTPNKERELHKSSHSRSFLSTVSAAAADQSNLERISKVSRRQAAFSSSMSAPHNMMENPRRCPRSIVAAALWETL
jgi:hypothetical protein